MRPRIVLTLIISAIAFAATGVAQSQSANDMFQEAWRFQESKGDLGKAIDLYKALVDRYPNTTVAPKALIGLAECYENLGRPEAADVYRQILSRYANSGAPAAAARARLAAMDQKSGPVVTARRVWDASTGAYGGVSPDGRFITTVNWETGALAVHELSSGKNRDITAGSSEQAADSKPSADGHSIAYVWYVDEPYRVELRVIPLNGGPFKVLNPSAAKAADISVWAWTSDSRAILATTATVTPGSGAGRTRRTQTLFLIPVDGGSAKQVKQFALAEEPGHFAMSPDGRYVAYDLPAAGRPERDLFVLSVKDGVVTPVAHQADDRMLSWLPDGSGIFFNSDRAGTYGIWTMNMSNGQPAAPATLVKPDTGLISALGFTRNRDFYYETADRDDDVSIATIDPATGKQTGTPPRLEGRFVRGKTQGVWSPDGSRIAYFQDIRLGPARATPPPGSGPAGGVPAADRRLAIHTLATGDVRLIDPELRAMGFPTWTRDGRSVIVNGAESANRQGLIQIDVETGTTKVLVSSQPSTEFRRLTPAAGPDGRSVFFHLVPAGVNVTVTDEGGIASRDLASGTEKIVVAGRVTAFAVSPDSRWIAKTSTEGTSTVLNHLAIVPASGGEPKSLAAGVADWKLRGPVAWSPDGRFIYVVRTDLPVNDEIVQVPLDGSAPRRTGILWRGVTGRIDVHPDGRRIAVSNEGVKSETWVLQGIRK